MTREANEITCKECLLDIMVCRNVIFCDILGLGSPGQIDNQNAGIESLYTRSVIKFQVCPKRKNTEKNRNRS